MERTDSSPSRSESNAPTFAPKGLDPSLHALMQQTHSLAAHLDQRITALFAHQDERIGSLLHANIAYLEERFGAVMHGYFAHLDQRLEDRFLFGQRPPPHSQEKQRILELAALLRPMGLVDCGKVRIGSEHDGGYILADRLDGTDALSLGIADDVSWDLVMAERGYRVHQFDHTVETLPQTHERFAFHQLRIAALPEPNSTTVSEILSTLNAPRRPVLKIDIEGDEWAVFAEMDEADLRKFDQIVCEFHGFGSIADEAWFLRAREALTKISRDFAVIHVHANNYGPLQIVGNVPFPELLEVSFANRQSFEVEETSERFPTALDMPNKADRPDIELFDFKFASSRPPE